MKTAIVGKEAALEGRTKRISSEITTMQRAFDKPVPLLKRPNAQQPVSVKALAQVASGAQVGNRFLGPLLQPCS
jgi:hypothetical protein